MPDQPFAGLVFKTISDPNGDLTFIRIYTGVMNQGDESYNARTRRFERIGRLVRMHAAQREPIDSASAGDIVAAVGIENSITGDTLSTRENPVIYEAMNFPDTVISMAIEPKSSSGSATSCPRSSASSCARIRRSRRAPTSRPARWSSRAWASLASR